MSVFVSDTGGERDPIALKAASTSKTPERATVFDAPRVHGDAHAFVHAHICRRHGFMRQSYAFIYAHTVTANQMSTNAAFGRSGVGLCACTSGSGVTGLRRYSVAHWHALQRCHIVDNDDDDDEDDGAVCQFTCDYITSEWRTLTILHVRQWYNGATKVMPIASSVRYRDNLALTS